MLWWDCTAGQDNICLLWSLMQCVLNSHGQVCYWCVTSEDSNEFDHQRILTSAFNACAHKIYTPKFRTEAYWIVASACWKWVNVWAHAISTLCACSKWSCKTARLRRLVWANTGYPWDKYLHLTKWLIAHGRHFQWRINIWATFAALSLYALAHQTSGQFPHARLKYLQHISSHVERRLWRDCAYVQQEPAHLHRLNRVTTISKHQVVGIWRYTLKQLEPASLDNYTCSFNE